ncbi:MAG: hypothetical protein AB1790_10540 [Pseudomonadota bacterium]
MDQPTADRATPIERPCGNDVRAWCKARGIVLLGMEARADMTVIRIRT